MTAPAAGWYPDPAGGGGQRWWNGASWSEQVQAAPAAQPVASAGQQWGAYQPAGQTGQHWGGQQPPAPAGFAKRNLNSLLAVGLSVLLVVLAATVHVVVLAVLPAFAAVAAIKAIEQLAWPAAGITAAVLIFAVVNFF